MPESILTETKAELGISENDNAFDLEVRLHINNAFSTLHDLGIGPTDGFTITDATKVWTDFISPGPMLNKVKEFLYLKVRYSFDPPGTGFHTTAMKELIAEEQARLSYAREFTDWTPPVPVSEEDIPEDIFGDSIILDGG